ncbi:hypothetical protein DRW07_15150 [Alteromonas sediminis]|uniref:Uncharacterized protein n=1 Tax=Alteromonas sediminis TaxID=2259342 RepID=A0A3N5XXQ3_9ALTE|nr:hypothetical protein [Alteromonas sediminis]RPJ65243.1 hypothetical protein DRW07_15150 [Alteromonas sediminis]
MKRLFVVTSVLFVSLLAPVLSQASELVEKKLFVCNTVSPVNNESCSTYSVQNLSNLAAVSLYSNGSKRVESAITEVTILVVNASAASSTFYSFIRSSSGSMVSYQILRNGPDETEIVDSVLEAENFYERVEQELTFNVSARGNATSLSGESLAAFSNAGAYSSSSSNPVGDVCPSAIAYEINMVCSGALNTHLDDMNEQVDSYLKTFTEAMSRLNISLAVKNVNINPFLNDKWKTKFNFSDGSVLILDIELGQTLGISVNQFESSLANGTQFDNYIRNKNDIYALDGGRFSGGEAKAIFRTLGLECSSILHSFGYDREYLITKTKDGRIIAVEMIDETPTTIDGHIGCDL